MSAQVTHPGRTIFAVKVRKGQEREVANSIPALSSEGGRDIFSVLSPDSLPGYVLVEAGEGAGETLSRVRGVKSVVGAETIEKELLAYVPNAKSLEDLMTAFRRR